MPPRPPPTILLVHFSDPDPAHDRAKLRKFQMYFFFWLTTILFLWELLGLAARGEISRFGSRHGLRVVYADHPGETLLNLLAYFVIGPLPWLGACFFNHADLFFKPKPLPPPAVHQADLLEDPEKMDEWRGPAP